MGQTVDVKRKIYGISTFKNVVDVNFNQLVPKDAPVVVTKPTNVDDFFKSYDELFYDIPAVGDTNSHLELINRSSDYIGVSLAELEEEIKTLRQENVSLKNQLATLTTNNK